MSIETFDLGEKNEPDNLRYKKQYFISQYVHPIMFDIELDWELPN